MSFCYRVLGASFLSFAFAQGTHSASGSPVTAGKDVVELRESIPGLNDGTDAGSVVDFFAPMEMRVIGGNDSTWRGDNPNWAPVLKLISDDLKQDLEPALAAQAAENAVLWNRELATHLSSAQVARLLAFYRSDTGRRYLAFQQRLMELEAQGSTALVGAVASLGLATKGNEASPATPAQLETRKKLAALSWITVIAPALGVASSPSKGANARADKEISDMMTDALVKMRGSEIDALHEQYQDDLPAFSAFQKSDAARALIAVYGDVAKDVAAETVKPGTGFKAALDQSIARHTPAWKAAYESGKSGQQGAK